MRPAIVGLSLMLAAAAVLPLPLAAQQSVDLTVNDFGISIGDSRKVNGLRINFRDRYLEEVNGINITVWTPREFTGVVKGLAIGLPATGARRIEGIGVGLIGLGVEEEARGLMIGGIGIGAGSDFRGIAIGGIGLGAGSNVTGIAIGGIGAGVGGSLRGLSIAGIGAGVGGSAEGIMISGIGAGVGGALRGLSVAGIGFGVGGSMRGVTVAGVGFGAGGDASGIQIAGVGMGVGGTLRYVSVAGAAIGAPRIEGLAVAPVIGSERTNGVIIAPFYFRIANDGRASGFNFSVYNDVRGTQQGLALGILNYARVLDGLQVGLINYAANKPRGTRLLPIVNFARAARTSEARQ